MTNFNATLAAPASLTDQVGEVFSAALLVLGGVLALLTIAAATIV